MSERADAHRAEPIPDVVVLYGGLSAEAEISVVSGSALAASLAERGAAVTQLLITREGSAALLPIGHLRGERSPHHYTSDRRAATLVATPLRPLREVLQRVISERPDAVYLPALHGPGDESGEVQQLLGDAGVAFVGAASTAARLGMEKGEFKELAASIGISVLPHLIISVSEWTGQRAESLRRIREFAGDATDDGALIGKPVAHGSSIGMRIARGEAEWGLAVDLALQHGDRALLEPYLDHPRELEVALLESPDGSVAAFGPGEVFPGHDFYDYDAKYLPGLSRTTATPDLSDTLRGELQRSAIRLFVRFGGRGLARMDYLVCTSGQRVGEWYLSEVNTFPGFTPISLFPALVTASGGSFADLALHLVRTALQQRRDGR